MVYPIEALPNPSHPVLGLPVAANPGLPGQRDSGGDAELDQRVSDQGVSLSTAGLPSKAPLEPGLTERGMILSPASEATSAALDLDVGGSGSTPQGEVNVLLVSDAPLSSFPSAPVRMGQCFCSNDFFFTDEMTSCKVLYILRKGDFIVKVVFLNWQSVMRRF